MELDDVLRKLRKLQSLYDGAKKINSEEEAATAAAMIQNLLAKYNLSIAEIGTEEQRSKQDEVLEEHVSGYTHKSIGGVWEYRLWYVLCKHNFCKCFMHGDSYKSLLVFGNKENLEVVHWMFNMLAERFVEFSKTRFKEYQQTIEYQHSWRPCSKDRYQRGYLQAAVAGLDKKLTEIAERNKQVEPEFATKVTALTVRTDGAIMENKWGKNCVRNIRKNYTAGNADSSQRGFHDGYNTDIHKPIRESNQRAVSNVKLLS